MLDFSEVEAKILQRLAPLRDRDILARALPDKPGEYGKITGQGVLLLALEGIQPVNTSLSGGVQSRLYTLVIDGRLKAIRSAAGFYQVTPELDRLLSGWRVPNFGQLTFAGVQLQERTESYWRFEARWTILRMDAPARFQAA